MRRAGGWQTDGRRMKECCAAHVNAARAGRPSTTKKPDARPHLHAESRYQLLLLVTIAFISRGRHPCKAFQLALPSALMHLDHLFHTIPNQPAEHAHPRPLTFWHLANFVPLLHASFLHTRCSASRIFGPNAYSPSLL